MKKNLTFPSISVALLIVFPLILTIILIFDAPTTKILEYPYKNWNSGVYSFFSSVTLNKDETITVKVKPGLCRGNESIKLTDTSDIVLHNNDSISTCPEYVGTAITYKGIKGGKLLFEVKNWSEQEPFLQKGMALISPYSSK